MCCSTITLMQLLSSSKICHHFFRRSMSSGAVGSVRRVRNPVEAARAVMERSEHALLVGDEASAWAEAQGLQMEDEVGE